MRIAQIAPLYESVPPQGYGGTERVVHVLTEQLVALGHEATLFASGDFIDEGVTGLLVDDMKGAIAAVRRISALSRERVRSRFDQRFSARRMAKDYLRVYDRVRRMHRRRPGPSAASGRSTAAKAARTYAGLRFCTGTEVHDATDGAFSRYPPAGSSSASTCLTTS
jgi:hypothetical protein